MHFCSDKHFFLKSTFTIKAMKRLHLIMASILALLFAPANSFSTETQDVILPTSISFKQLPNLEYDENGNLILYVGDTIQLQDLIVFTPENATEITLEWSSSWLGYFYLDPYTGQIIGQEETRNGRPEKVTVRVFSDLLEWYNTIETHCYIIVKKRVITELSLTPDTLILNRGESAKITANVVPAKAADQVIWTNKNEAVATLAEDGTVTALKAGYTNVIVKSSNRRDETPIMDTCVVIVSAKYENNPLKSDSIVFDVHEYALDIYEDIISSEISCQLSDNLNIGFYGGAKYSESKGVYWESNQKSANIYINGSNRYIHSIRYHFNEDVSNLDIKIDGSFGSISSYWKSVETNNPYTKEFRYEGNGDYPTNATLRLKSGKALSVSKVVITYSKLPYQLSLCLNAESASLWDEVYLYASSLNGKYTSNGLDTIPEEILSAVTTWPGVKVEKNKDGWYSYTFSEKIGSVSGITWNCGDSTAISKMNNSSTNHSMAYALNKKKPEFGQYSIQASPVNYDLFVYEEAPEDNALPKFPNAELWYDFDGSGEKGILIKGSYYFEAENKDHNCILSTTGISKGFKETFISTMPDQWNATYLYTVEDINGDGKMDITTTGDNFESVISQGTEYNYQEHALVIPNFDINNDGRIDYLLNKDLENEWSIMVQQPDGSFKEQYMQMITPEEYKTTFDPTKWGNTDGKSTGRGTFRPNVNSIGANPAFGGVWLPPRTTHVTTKLAPSFATDLNADGYTDIVDEANGLFYYNAGDGKWVKTSLGCTDVLIADLNGDKILDFIYPGAKLQTVIYKGNGEFDVQVLYENIQVDRKMYCYDFDKDGDSDILVTFSAPLNSTGYAYTMFFENDGSGSFTQLDEQDYGDNQLLFTNCQDLDGDGYYDMLAFRGVFDDRDYCLTSENLEIVWLKGLPNKTFANPEAVITLEKSNSISDSWFRKDIESLTINAEDIDNDGLMEIWTTDIKNLSSQYNESYDITYIYNFSGKANNAPTAPGKPELTYSNGYLTINWDNGTDDNTAVCDLTYALRIGSTPGSSDILHAHANADGSRRNFLDGNMGKHQTYTIDLSSHNPGAIYVSVQAIDAQHVGSAWSEEATTKNILFADFNLSAQAIGKGVTLTATAIALPEGYTHSWKAEDGEVTGQGNSVEISFTSIGDKLITHTITTADGTTISATESVNVMPNYVSQLMRMDRNEAYLYRKSNYWYFDTYAPRIMADYNMDGYWDVIGLNNSAGTLQKAINKGSEQYTFTKAAGIWNTGLDIEKAFWYDWDHNGAAEPIIMSYDEADFYYLPHNGTTNLKAKVSDSNISYLMNTDYSSSGYYNPYIDFTHNGYYDVFSEDYKNGENYIYMHSRQADGSFNQEIIEYDGIEFQLLYQILTNNNDHHVFYTDIDHDGYTEICVLVYDTRYKEPYSKMIVLRNNGDSHFEVSRIPFTQPISSASTNGGNDLYSPYFEDINSDGYYDIIASRADGAIYIMWNESNQSFSAPEIVPLGILDGFLQIGKVQIPGSFNTNTVERQIEIADIDNNGYPDIISLQHNKSLGYSGYGMYVHYFGPNGVIRQGFVEQNGLIGATQNVTGFDIFKLPNHKWTMLYNGTIHYEDTDENDGGYVTIEGNTNESPSIPEGLRAVQRENDLLIEWNSANDDFTPSTQMRYNLSVKKKGESGTGAYIISPQNATNSKAAPMQNHTYIAATQYIIPLNVLPVGEYEIQVQAIDLQNDWSAFTEPITIAIQHENIIEAPSSICLEENALFTYMGESTNATPEWNFDGGNILSGSGFGPYRIYWDTPGTKQVTLTVNNEIYTRMIYVDKNETSIDFPTIVIENIPLTVNIPIGMNVSWHFKLNNGTYAPISNYHSIVSEHKGALTFHKDNKDNEIENYILVAFIENESGCESVIEFNVSIVGKDAMPNISVVTADSNGNNVIKWETPSKVWFSQVRILKETNRYNQFVEIGTASIYDGQYTDKSSNAATKSERYVIQPLMNGVEMPLSDKHQTSHLTINQGINNNIWNLIWNNYVGANVVSYNILRGTSADNMDVIASVNSGTLSFTDYSPDSNAPYYAIEYVIAENARAARKMTKAGTAVSGRSNVVNSNNTASTIHVKSINILSANGSYETNATNSALALYAETMPINASYKQVKWEIVKGHDLATISYDGILMATTPNEGGKVTVKATTLDGTNLTATKTITIGAIIDTGIEQIVPDNDSISDSYEQSSVRKVLEDGQLYIILPNGTKYTSTGIRVE